MLQAGRSPVRVPDEVDFFNLPNLSSCTMALGSTQPLTEMVPEIFRGVKSGRRVGLTTLPPSVSRMSENVGASNSRNPKDLHDLYRETFTFYRHNFTFFTIHREKDRHRRIHRQQVGIIILLFLKNKK
jgi:hypothetical protein